MIHTVTLNPTLDIWYELETFSFGEPVTALSTSKSPGGKGINVSRALQDMGMESIAIGLFGGYVGEDVLYLLQEEGLVLQVIRIQNETRANVIIYSEGDGRQLMIRSVGPPVEPTRTQSICDRIFQMTKELDTMIISGSLPPGISDDIYRSLIERAKNMNARVILDADGIPLRKGIDALPYMIKPNRVELEGLAGTALSDDDSIIEYCGGLIEKGLSVVLVSLGGDGALIVSREGVWRGRVPLVEGDTVGAGDSTVAGFVMGLTRDEPLDQAFRMGLACGVSTVMHEGAGLCEPELYRKALPEIEVKRLR